MAGGRLSDNETTRISTHFIPSPGYNHCYKLQDNEKSHRFDKCAYHLISINCSLVIRRRVVVVVHKPWVDDNITSIFSTRRVQPPPKQESQYQPPSDLSPILQNVLGRKEKRGNNSGRKIIILDFPLRFLIAERTRDDHSYLSDSLPLLLCLIGIISHTI